MAQEPQPVDERLPALLAYFRDTMRRTVGWRDRLDRTTNWAVVISASLLTWSFSGGRNPHFVILIGMASVTFFWFLEARRYRRYDVWRSRLRLIERDLLAPHFDPKLAPKEDCWELLAQDLVTPSFKVPFYEALQRRLRRTYGFLILLLLVAWGLSVAESESSFLEAAAVGVLPGGLVVGGVLAYGGSVLALSVWPLERRAMEDLSEEKAKSDRWREDDPR